MALGHEAAPESEEEFAGEPFGPHRPDARGG